MDAKMRKYLIRLGSAIIIILNLATFFWPEVYHNSHLTAWLTMVIGAAIFLSSLLSLYKKDKLKKIS
ncbi:MAG: hypothetical protein POG74_02150 [Acidocella sp.]|nr:hypothetical protein [Acidocella sp.]